LWSRFNYPTSSANPDLCLIPRPLLDNLQRVACYST
jgi:hypothetical protein